MTKKQPYSKAEFQFDFPGFLRLNQNRIVCVNEYFSKLLGYTKKEIYHKKDPFFFIHPEYKRKIKQSIIENLKNYSSQMPKIFEFKALDKYNKKILLKTYNSISRNSNNVYQAVVIDVSDKKEEKDKYRTLVQNSQDVMLILNKDGTRRFVNNAVEEITGYKPEELQENFFGDILPEKETKKITKRWNELLLSDNRKFRLEHQMKHKDGRDLVLEVVGQNFFDDQSIQGIIASVRDITERKKLERKLRVSEEQFSKAFHNNPLMSSISTIEDGRYLEVNNKVLDLLGYKKNEIIGKTSLELGIMLPQDRARLKEILLSKGEVKGVELDLYKKSGEPVKCLIYGTIIRIEADNKLLALIQDISKQKATEKKLRNSKKMLSAQYKSDPIPTYTWKHTNKEFILIDFNDAAVKITNGKIKEFKGKRLKEVFKNKPKLIEDINECYDKKSKIEKELEYKFISTGKKKYLNVKYTYVPENMILVHTEDITSRKNAELELIEARNTYRKLFNNSLVGILLVKRDGNIVKTNTALCKFMGYKESELLNKNVLDFYQYPSQRKKAVAQLEKTGRLENFSAPMVRKDGSIIYLIANSSKVILRGEEFYQTTCMDITDLKKAEEKLKKHKEKLVSLVDKRTANLRKEIKERKIAEKELNRSLQEKKILIKEINHRVKNNLQILSGIFDLQALKEDNNKIQKILLEGKNRIKSMALIYDLLYHSEDISHINFSNYIKNLIEIIQETFQQKRKNICIETDLEEIYLPMSKANPCAMVVNEIVVNAFLHAFPHNYQGERKISISSSELSNSKVEIIVKDNGIGLPPKINLDNYNTLGFHLIKILVEDQLEGEIDLKRTEGTLFRIIFYKE